MAISSTSWRKGSSGNPSGRPAAGDSLAEAFRLEMSAKDRKAIARRMIDLAAEGDMSAARLLLSYVDGVPIQRTETTVTEQVADHPQWILLRTTLLQALEPFPHARDAIAAVLSDNVAN